MPRRQHGGHVNIFSAVCRDIPSRLEPEGIAFSSPSHLFGIGARGWRILGIDMWGCSCHHDSLTQQSAHKHTHIPDIIILVLSYSY